MDGDAVGGAIRWRMHVPSAPEAVFAALDTGVGLIKGDDVAG